MPREQKKRGRRAQKQQRNENDDGQPSSKRQRMSGQQEHPSDDLIINGDAGDDFISFQVPQEQQFYGLLDEEEQEYYANVNNKIIANDFETDEDLDLFTEAVYRESKGKEIKLASSQSCSRYLERLIQISKPAQLRSLFAAFLQDLSYLAQHRFGSHCCESLFQRSAVFVDKNGDTGDETTLEFMFLKAADLLKSNVAYLLTDRFASHTIRVLLLVLSGDDLEDSSLKSVIASEKKERLDSQSEENATNKDSRAHRTVPSLFRSALTEFISSAASSMDLIYLRSLATHPIGSPAIQMLLRFELTASNESRHISTKQLIKKLLPDEDLEADSESGKFLSGLVYDPTGSHVVETLVKYLPGKHFKKMYKNLYRDRIGKLAKNDIAGHVAVRIMERIGKDDLADARDKIVIETPGLLQRHRLFVIQSLIERCETRQVNLDGLVAILKSNELTSPSNLMSFLLQPQETTEDESVNNGIAKSNHDAKKIDRTDVAGSRLAQSMLQCRATYPLVHEAVLQLSEEYLISIANNPISSRIIQGALTSPYSDAKFLKQLITRLIPFIEELVINSAGSHVVDALWDGTKSSHFLKERIAQELQKSETRLRESQYGRNVWRNWQMDVFQRRPREWHNKARGYVNTEKPEPEEVWEFLMDF